jgi:hypothetical protein
MLLVLTVATAFSLPFGLQDIRENGKDWRFCTLCTSYFNGRWFRLSLNWQIKLSGRFFLDEF